MGDLCTLVVWGVLGDKERSQDANGQDACAFLPLFT